MKLLQFGVAGTEEGLVHRCSVTYSEQYLATYSGHMGPVTALQWCPFRPSLFLSASADWTLKLWEEGQVCLMDRSSELLAQSSC